MKSLIKNILFISVTFFLFFKIIFYYLFTNKMARLRDTIIEFIIMLTKTKRREFYSQNFNNKKNTNLINKKINDLAILIPCQLRCWEQSKDLIFSLAEEHHVFIFTDPEYAHITNNINHKNIHVFLSNNKKYSMKQKYIFDNQLQQWFKLHCLINEIYEFEKENDIFFKSFLKIRTDFAYLNQNELVNIAREMQEDCLFAKSDISFSGRREFFLPLCNFFEAASQVYINFNNRFLPICTSQIINSDYDSYRLHWLKYPKKIIGNINHKIVLKSFDIKNLITRHENQILEMNKRLENQELTQAYTNDKFSSEQIFARYLNLNNIVCKNHEKFIGALIDQRVKGNNKPN